jgi:hypothetical protein
MLSELYHRAGSLFCGLSAGIFITGQALALDPGYVEAVEADVAEFTSHQFQAPTGSGWLGDDKTSAQLLDQQGFSDFLQSTSPGSFIFYEKLPDKYQKLLHQDYLVTGDLDRIKQDIFKYTRQVKN